jgi:hypothetical protein
MIFKKQGLKDVFREPPMAALMQPPNLGKVMCRAALSQHKREDGLGIKPNHSALGWKKFGKGSTTCGPLALPSTQTVTAQVTGYSHQIRYPVTYETQNCVYYWKRVKPNCK